MELLKKHKLALSKNPKAVVDRVEQNEIDVIESLLPIHALIVFRQLVSKEVILEQHKQNQEKLKGSTKRRVSTFFKSAFSSRKVNEDDDDHGDEEDITLQAVSETK